MGGQRRRRLDAGTWGQVLERFAAAGTTVGEFCARERLSASSFYRWRERLQAGGTSAMVESRLPRVAGVEMSPGAAGFIDLGSLPESSCGAGGGLELRLDLGGGVVLQIIRR
jgi:putative transposase